MAVSYFKSFWSTVSKWHASPWVPNYRLIFDNDSGVPIGIVSPNANGPDGIWAPTPLSAAQIQAPTALMLADLNATYQLNVAPYTRYQSNGSILVAVTEAASDGTTFPGAVMQTVAPFTSPLTVGANSYAVIYSPWTIQSAAGVSVAGRVDVIARPA